MGIQKTFKALSDRNRRQILDLLKRRPMTAGEIGEHFPVSGATMSHHLSILKDAELILDDRQGKYIYYELNTSVVEELISWVSGLKEGGASS
jgi:DNA-binding transcriptional ArsR family regulator